MIIATDVVMMMHRHGLGGRFGYISQRPSISRFLLVLVLMLVLVCMCMCVLFIICMNVSGP